MTGIQLPSLRAEQERPDSAAARIEAAEAREQLKIAYRYTPSQLRNEFVRLQRENAQLKAQLGEATELVRRLQAGQGGARVLPEPVPELVKKTKRRGVRCAGGCGELVTADYRVRTGLSWHPLCAAQVPAEIRTKVLARAQGRVA